MSEMNMVEAVRAALRNALIADDRVVVLGEDIGALGGVFRATDGLLKEFGEARIIDTPMAELSIVGMAIGMALRGLRPIAEIQFGDFIWAAADQIFNEAAKIRFRTSGEWQVPLVIRAPWGAGIHGALYHSQSIEAAFCHYPGLKVVAASTPADAAGLLQSAIADPDPVIVLEHKLAYRRARGEVADASATVPLGEAAVVRPGADVSVFAYGWMVHEALAAADQLAAQGGPQLEVIDLRTLSPLDRPRIVESVTRTGRACVVHEDVRTLGLGAELSALIHESCFSSLRAPVARVTMPDVAGIPFAAPQEEAILPGAKDIVRAANALVENSRQVVHAGGAAVSTAGGRLGPPLAAMAMTATPRDAQTGVELLAQLVSAAAVALTEVGDANSVWAADGLAAQPVNIELRYRDEDGEPRRVVIADAEQLSLIAIRRLLRAEAPASDPEALPSFTLSCPGPGISGGFPSVPDGQTAAVQVTDPVPSVVSDGDGIQIRSIMTLSLSADHRVLDGAGSAAFLKTMIRQLEAQP